MAVELRRRAELFKFCNLYAWPLRCIQIAGTLLNLLHNLEYYFRNICSF